MMSKYHRRRDALQCVDCGVYTGGPIRCDEHRLRNNRYRMDSWRRHRTVPPQRRCSLCDDLGHYRTTCKAEPTR